MGQRAVPQIHGVAVCSAAPSLARALCLSRCQHTLTDRGFAPLRSPFDTQYLCSRVDTDRVSTRGLAGHTSNVVCTLPPAALIAPCCSAFKRYARQPATLASATSPHSLLGLLLAAQHLFVACVCAAIAQPCERGFRVAVCVNQKHTMCCQMQPAL